MPFCPTLTMHTQRPQAAIANRASKAFASLPPTAVHAAPTHANGPLLGLPEDAMPSRRTRRRVPLQRLPTAATDQQGHASPEKHAASAGGQQGQTVQQHKPSTAVKSSARGPRPRPAAQQDWHSQWQDAPPKQPHPVNRSVQDELRSNSTTASSQSRTDQAAGGQSTTTLPFARTQPAPSTSPAVRPRNPNTRGLTHQPNHQISHQQHPASPRGYHQVPPAGLQSLLDRLLSWGPERTQAKAAWLREAQRSAGFLRQLRVVPHRPNLPVINGLVIVEGPADCAAVHRAVNAVVYLCDGSAVKSGAVLDDLPLLHSWPYGSVILTDPDAPGRELRMFLDDHLVQRAQHGLRGAATKHAFISVQDATATTPTRWHEQGSTGVENASADVVRASFQGARYSYPPTRKEFTVKELQDRGLSNTFDAKQTDGARLRRKLLCDRLGIDVCTGKSLATMLNTFFERDELEAAIAALPPTE